jgi:TonB family protein
VEPGSRKTASKAGHRPSSGFGPLVGDRARHAEARGIVVPVRSHTTTFLAVLLAAALLVPSMARAGEPTAEVRLPVVTTPASVGYPSQAIAERHFVETTVVLVLDIDKTGVVGRAVAETPQGHGFDEAAIAAAAGMRFEPAARGDVPIAARLKFQFVFKPPKPRLRGRVATRDEAPIAAQVLVTLADGSIRTLTTESSGKWELSELPAGATRVLVHADGMVDDTVNVKLEYAEEADVVTRLEPVPAKVAQAPAAPEEEVQEVSVLGTKPPREVTKRTLSREEIEKIPGTNGDALRSLQSLPGVARPPFIGGQLIVRGSAPAETTIFVDGTPVPIAYHFGGLSSVLPTEALERLDFYPGNYGTTYGRGTAGMVDVALRNPKDKYHGFAQFDLIDARLHVEGPIGNTGWKFLASGRRSWFDVWLGPILAQTGGGISTLPRYYDYQLMVQKHFGPRASFRTTFFGSDDAFAITRTESSAASAGQGGGFDNKTRFWRLQSIYKNQFSDAGEFKVTAAAGRDQVSISVGQNFISTVEYPFSVRAEVSQRISRGVRANVGLDMIYAPYDLSLRLPSRLEPGTIPVPGTPPVSSTASGERGFAGAYTELEVVPWTGGRVVPGFRADYASTTTSWDFAPRLNMRQDVVSGIPRTTIKGGVGLYHQPPSALQTDPTYGQKDLRSARSVHYALGAEQQFSEHVELSVEGFAKSIDRIVVTGAGNSGEGRAYGAEWMLRYRGHPKFFGWLSYTLSRSERRDSANEAWHLFQYDQTHILTVLGSYDLGKGYRLGGRFRLISGNLYTPSVDGGYDASSGTYVAASREPAYGERLPAFHNLDVRFDKTWTFQAWKLSFYADIQNIYNRRSVEGVSYNYNYTASQYTEGLTILPSLGLRGEL